MDQLTADRISIARHAKAKKIAKYLMDYFLNTVEHLTPEERQNCAAKAGVNAATPPSDESWAIVLSILKGPE